jgi:choline dehydrogenase-like flavoprotein
VPDARVNAANRAMQAGMEALGYKGGRMSHNRDGDCRASGFCEVGCPNNGKAHAAKVLIPPALRAGARILTEARVDRVLFRNGAVYGVSGYAVCAQTRMDVAPFVILAKRVIMGASATGSAAVLLRSGVPDPRRLMGSNLHLHPGAVVAGVFDKEGQDPIRAWEGVPQSVECTEFLEFGRGARRRAWLVPGFAHPGGAALFVPGFGSQHAALMRLFPRLAVMIVMLHDHSRGRVSPGEGERVHLRYKLDDEDREQLALGMREAGKILLAGGASRVMVPTSPPLWARTEGELSRLQARDLGPLNPALTAVHPMSTLWMGADPVRSVVDGRGEHHHLRGLYVADGSLFPTSIGGPPQIPIYTFGRRVGRAVLGSLR